MNARIAAWLLVLVVPLACGGLFFACFEQQEIEVPARQSAEARENRYLALGRFLDAMGHEVVTLDAPAVGDALPPPDATLLLPTTRHTLSAEANEQLLDWVEAGGHLIVVTHSVWDDPYRAEDPLLDRYGLQQYEHEEEEEEAEAGEALEGEAEAADAPGEEAKPVEEGDSAEDLDFARLFGAAEDYEWDESVAHWPGLERPLRVHFHPTYYWVDADERASWTVGGEAGLHLVQLPVGAGRITALTDEIFLSNRFVGDADHAELFLRLARQGGERGPVWITREEESAGLFALLWSKAPAVVASFVALMAAWLWRASRRFGPLHGAVELPRRRWMEHLEAVARYHWRSDQGRALLDGCRTAVQRALERAHPTWSRLPVSERAERLSASVGLPAEVVARALDPHALREGEAAFVDDVAILEKIRASL